jgi:hypothetical protein
MVYDSSMLIDGEWVPQDEESINMLEAFNDPILGDMWACAHHSFLRDLFLSTPCEDLKVRMLGSLEPMCLGETVDNEGATVEELDERQYIYAHHVAAEAALAAAAAANVSADADDPAHAEAPLHAPAADGDA